MSNYMKFAIIGFLGICYILSMSCDKPNEPEPTYDFPDPIDAVAMNITIEIYSSYLDTILETDELNTEGPKVIECDSLTWEYSEGVSVFAKAEGFYTELYNCDCGDTIDVDLDGVPEAPYALTGAFFRYVEFFSHLYYDEKDLEISGPNGFLEMITTDEQGRFGLADLPAGTYSISLTCPGYPDVFEVVNSHHTDYTDFSYLESSVVDAPYIYLYPEIDTDVSVKVNFPYNGRITESEPPYSDGWNVHVTPDGIIDDQYEYLFYEGESAVPLNHGAAWMLNGGALENEMRDLLQNLGFIGREIDDFVEFWLPIIEGSSWYAFFPQDTESMIVLDITPAPDNVLRALFVILPLEWPIPIPEPEITGDFDRSGFVAV